MPGRRGSADPARPLVDRGDRRLGRGSRVSAVLCAVLVALAAAVVWPGRSSPPRDARVAPSVRAGDSVLVRHRMVLALVSGLAGITLIGGLTVWLVAAGMRPGVWTPLGGMGPARVPSGRATGRGER